MTEAFLQQKIQCLLDCMERRSYSATAITLFLGFSKAAKELGINIDTLYGWNKRAKEALLDLGPGAQTPDTAMSLAEEVQKLRQQNREQAKEIARLKEENEFLAGASAFFAASRRKSAKI